MDKLVGSMVEEMARAIWTAPITGQPRGQEVRAWPPRNADALKETMRQAQACAAIAQKRVIELEAAARALVDKLDECAPAAANLSAMQFVRSGVQYTGPSYGEALEDLRAALPAPEVPGESEEEMK